MFEDATFHSSGVLPNQTPKWMLLALGVNLTALSALIVLPLLYPQGLPGRLLQQTLFAPPVLAAQPQPRSSQPAATQASVIHTCSLFLRKFLPQPNSTAKSPHLPRRSAT